MDLLPVFVAPDLELRSGWRIAAWLSLVAVLFVASAVLLGGAASLVRPDWLEVPPGDVRRLALNAAGLIGPVIAALWIVCRLIDRVPLSVFGVSMHDRWKRDFVMGLAVSGVMLGVVLATSAAFGELRVEWSFTTGSIPTILVTLGVLAVSAANEELLFRGYPLQVLMKGVGPWAAALAISVVFGLVHRDNAAATTLSVINTVIAGLMLSGAYLKTRSLWLPYGVHLGWNAGLAVVLGFPVSGIDTASIWTTRVTGPEAILGGAYGPEDGAVGTAVFLTGAACLLALRGVGVSPEMRARLAAHAGKVWLGKA